MGDKMRILGKHGATLMMLMVNVVVVYADLSRE